MSTLSCFLVALALAVLALLAHASTRPDEFRVERRARIAAEFALQPTADGAAEVRRTMSGPANVVSKLMGVFIDMDKRVGLNFKDGLHNLRQLAEART